MRVDSYPHESQRLTWVPRAAVRHAQMSRNTRRCCRESGMSPGGEEFLLVLTKDIGDFRADAPSLCWRSSFAGERAER